MTDADLASRMNAYDRSGRLVAWTPEAVGFRMIESYRVFDRTPMQIGPRSNSGFWPNVVMSWEDLIDEKDRQRLMVAYGGEVDWKEWVEENDKQTLRQLSIDQAAKAGRRIAPPTAAQYSRAEEACRWPALFLAERPLLGDAISTWAFCIGCGLSIRERLDRRRKLADEFLAHVKTHARRRKTVNVTKTRQDLLPGKNFDRGLLGERRKVAAATICVGLRVSRVMVREADLDQLKFYDE